MVSANNCFHDTIGWFNGAGTRLSSSSLYLYAILKAVFINILGISAWYHDSAACLLIDGRIVAAAQEERFTRIKHDPQFPSESILYCISEAGLIPSDIDNIVFYDKPFLKFERLLETYLAFAPAGFKSFAKSMPVWVKDKLFQKNSLIKHLDEVLGNSVLWKERLLFSEHHFSHAASAFFPSPFESAAILTLDGVGEWTTTSLAMGKGNELEVLKEIHFPHSLGLLYSSITYYLGFKVNSGEYKVMGLAPYGNPIYVSKIYENLIDVKDDGSYHLDLQYFDYCVGTTMTNSRFDDLFGGPRRSPESALTQRDLDIAASVQKVIEEILLKLAKNIAEVTGAKNLCLAGGVALNCVANGVLKKAKIFEDIWIQPASGDAGGAIGAALAAYHVVHGKPRELSLCRDGMQGTYLGPKFSNAQIEQVLTEAGACFQYLSDEEIVDVTAKALADSKAIGWMQGRMEFGPRALGARSIIADPRSPFMQAQLNLKVKYRESFRPFAPSILREQLEDWFNLDSDSPYMLIVADIIKARRKDLSTSEKAVLGLEQLKIQRSTIPAVTHVDFSARIQTVHKETNPKYHALIESFYGITGCPILINTSFNVRGEPIVCSPMDALKCFMSTELDVLVLENYILYKESQNPKLNEAYQERYELD